MNPQFYNLKEFKTDFDLLIKSHTDRIVITSHISPDDDAISSVLAIYYYLVTNQEIASTKVRVVFSNSPESRWSDFKYFEKIEFVPDIHNELSKKDLLIVLDTKEWDRITSHPEKIENLGLKSVCIDHHKSEVQESTTHNLMLIYPQIEYSSNAETIYWTFFHDNRKTLNKEICEILLLGIYGDTGSFTYIRGAGNTSSFLAAKNLIEIGDVEIDDLKNKYNKIPLGSLKILGNLLNNIIVKKIPGWPDFLVSFIEEKNSKEYADEEYSNAVGIFKNYLKSIKDIEWGFYVRYNRQEKAWGISFRAENGSVNVREIAQHFKGGGHDQAAGGKLEVVKGKKADFYIDQILDYLKNNKPTFTEKK